MNITREVTVRLTPEEAADTFWNNDSDWQAEFFSILATLAEHKMGLQLAWVTKSDLLTPCGRQVMAEIGEYADSYAHPVLP